MAVFDAVFTPSQRRAIKIPNLATTSASTEQAFGNGEIIAINADQDITIRFGPPGGVGAPDDTDFRLPQNTQSTFDMGNGWTSFKVFNRSTTTAANIWILPLSKV